MKSALRINFINSIVKVTLTVWKIYLKKPYHLGSHATYLSGSGPTILSILDGNYDGFKAGMEEYFKTNGLEWKCMILPIDNVGAVVSEI